MMAFTTTPFVLNPNEHEIVIHAQAGINANKKEKAQPFKLLSTASPSLSAAIRRRLRVLASRVLSSRLTCSLINSHFVPGLLPVSGNALILTFIRNISGNTAALCPGLRRSSGARSISRRSDVLDLTMLVREFGDRLGIS
jgi:hypothetical protein